NFCLSHLFSWRSGLEAIAVFYLERSNTSSACNLERAAAVQVDAAGAAAAVTEAEGDRPLEHVVELGRGVRGVDAEQVAQVDQERLRRRQFGGGDALPFVDEGVGGGVGARC